MAKIELLVPKILAFEGGYCNDPNDKGHETNMGVTLATYQSIFGSDKTVEDLKAMKVEQFTLVLKIYWDCWKADEIQNQSIAEILVDWVWASGKWGIIIPQRILAVEPDGIVGEKTIEALNNSDQPAIFDKIKTARFTFVNKIVNNDPTQKKFINGWTTRIASYNYIEQ